MQIYIYTISSVLSNIHAHNVKRSIKLNVEKLNRK